MEFIHDQQDNEGILTEEQKKKLQDLTRAIREAEEGSENDVYDLLEEMEEVEDD